MKNFHDRVLSGNALNDYIQYIKDKPHFSLRTRTLTELHALLSGYIEACYEFKIDGFGEFPLFALTSWLVRKYKITASIDWHYILLNQCQQDEEKAYNMFFEVWAEINELDREKLYNETFDDNGRLIDWWYINVKNED